MLSSSCIAGSFGLQCLQKELINLLHFLRRIIQYKNDNLETDTFSLIWPVLSSRG